MTADADDPPLLPRRGPRDEAKFDVTAMIDLVFMLNIFFLVTTVAAAMSEMDLPVVRHTVAADGDEAVIVSLVRRDGGTAVFFGEDVAGGGVADPDEQTRRVREAAEEGRRAEKSVVLIKAERDVRLRDVQRVAAAAAEVPGVELRAAVIERE